MRIKPVYILVSYIVALLFSTDAVSASNYNFGVFPYLPPTKLQQLFYPMAKDFGNGLKRSVELSSRNSFEGFSSELDNEQYDIAFVQPFDYLRLSEKRSYLPLARRGEPLRAVIIVLSESRIKSINGLKNKTLASPPEEAAVSRLATFELKKHGLESDLDVKRNYTKNHFSCMQQVLIGEAEACVTALQAMAHFEDKELRSRFKIIHESPPAANSLFVVHRRVPEKDRAVLRSIITGWHKNPEGRAILKNGEFAPFIVARDSDYDSLRMIKKSRPKARQ